MVVVVIGWGWYHKKEEDFGHWERTSVCFLWTRSGVIFSSYWKRQSRRFIVSLLSQALSCLACPAYTTALVLALLFRLCL